MDWAFLFFHYLPETSLRKGKMRIDRANLRVLSSLLFIKLVTYSFNMYIFNAIKPNAILVVLDTTQTGKIPNLFMECT